MGGEGEGGEGAVVRNSAVLQFLFIWGEEEEEEEGGRPAVPFSCH